jgi:hypothetical protein
LHDELKIFPVTERFVKSLIIRALALNGTNQAAGLVEGDDAASEDPSSLKTKLV